jgi:hypothetical protein
MQKKQSKNEALKCTYRNCQNLQNENGEFCEKHYPKVKSNIVKEILEEKKQSLESCWEYYQDLIKEQNHNLKKSELEDYLLNIQLQDFEDIGFYAGFLSGIDVSLEIVKFNQKNNLIEQLDEILEKIWKEAPLSKRIDIRAFQRAIKK